MATPFLCEANGARILQAATGITQVGDNYQLDVTTWDVVPMGEVGDNLFRSINVAGKMTNGVSLGITPIVDGVDLDEQLFGQSGAGEFQFEAFFDERGTRCAARVRTLSRTGDVELHNILVMYFGLRRVP